jgi:hypothetical protein
MKGTSTLVLAAARMSTKGNYGRKMKKYTKWCDNNGKWPDDFDIAALCNFFSDMIDDANTGSSVQVYAYAVSNHWCKLLPYVTSVTRNPLVVSFLKGSLRLTTKPLIPRVSWDIAKVLNYIEE